MVQDICVSFLKNAESLQGYSLAQTSDSFFYAGILLFFIAITSTVVISVYKKKWKVSLFFIPFFIFSIFLGINYAYAEATYKLDIPNKVNFTVENDGSYKFNPVNTINNEDNILELTNIKVENLCELDNVNWNINLGNTNIYNDKAGQSKEISCKYLPHQNLALSINCNVDMQKALQLVDKDVINVSLTFKKIVNVQFKNVDLTKANDDIEIYDGECIESPKNSTPPPGSAGWEFLGWFDKEGNPFNSDDPICQDITIYAHYKDPKVNMQTGYSIEKFLTKDSTRKASQGLEMYGNYIFACEDGGHVGVYDFDNCHGDTPVDPINRFKLGSTRSDNHVNNVEFGNKVYDGQEFPLLYISNGKVNSEIEYLCYVEQISKDEKNKFSSKVVQEITLDPNNWREHGYVPIFGAPSWLVDKEENALWVFSAYQRTTPAVTTANWQNEYIATKFNIPQYTPKETDEVDKITLGVDDIIDQVVFPYEIGFTQGGCIKNGLIYYCYGVGLASDKPPAIRVYDTHSKKIVAGYDLSDKINVEPEDIVIRKDEDGKDWIYLNTNNNAASLELYPLIYKIEMPKGVK